MDEYPIQWELVSDDTNAAIKTYRLKVPGGWLVMTEALGIPGISFVANPDGNWKLSTT
jgi:hypothetical protein